MNEVLYISINGNIGKSSIFSEGFSASDFVKALKGNAAKTVVLNISSNGGDVFEGFDIANEIIKQKNEGVNFVARIGARAASIATYIASVCNRIEAHQNSKWLIHAPFSPSAGGNAEDLIKQAGILKGMELDLLNVYVSKTGKSELEVKELMSQDKFITAQEAKDFGFIDEIINEEIASAEFKAVAYVDVEKLNQLNNNSMSEMKEVKSMFDEIKGFFKGFKNEVQNSVVIEGGEVSVGAKVTVEGQPAQDGTHKLADGTSIVTVGGVITEVLESESMEDMKKKDEEIAALKAEIETLKESKVSLDAQMEASKETTAKLEASIKENQSVIAEAASKFYKFEAAMKKELTAAQYVSVFGGNPVTIVNEPKKMASKVADSAMARILKG